VLRRALQVGRRVADLVGADPAGVDLAQQGASPERVVDDLPLRAHAPEGTRSSSTRRHRSHSVSSPRTLAICAAFTGVLPWRCIGSIHRASSWGEGVRMLELAILGLLHETSMHGYELRKQLSTKLGAFRAAISYGSLYPTLRRLQADGWITEESSAKAGAGGEVPLLTGRRGRVVYKITAEGKERFQELLARAGPETYDDTGFGVHFAFFARTDQATRLRILEGRRRRIEERRDGLREVLSRAAERLDAYT